MIRLYVIRHGETEDNAVGRITGRGDSPLTARGRAQAAANGQRLAALAGDVAGLDFVASPAGRAQTTMRLLRAAAGLPETGYRNDARLLELDGGAWTGLPHAEIHALRKAAVAATGTDPWNFAPPGGESREALLARVQAFLSELTRPAVAVTHAGPTRMLRGIVLGLGRAETWEAAIPQAGIFELSAAGERLHGG